MKQLINNVHYSYEIVGTGAPLLLLHGFTGSKNTWAPFIPMWSKKFQIISVDIIGHGETDSPEEVLPYTMPEVAEALEILLNNHGITKTHVLGYSMGGRLALYLMMTRPELIGSVLLESASPGLLSREEQESRIKHDTALADKIVRQGVEAFVNEWERIPLFSTQLSLPDAVKQRIRKERLSQTSQGLANSLRGMGTGMQPSLWESLTECHKQVMLVVGQLDTKFVNIAGEMEKQLPKCRKIVVEGVGHAVHVESPHIFGNIVYDDFSLMIEEKGRE